MYPISDLGTLFFGCLRFFLCVLRSIIEIFTQMAKQNYFFSALQWYIDTHLGERTYFKKVRSPKCGAIYGRVAEWNRFVLNISRFSSSMDLATHRKNRWHLKNTKNRVLQAENNSKAVYSRIIGLKYPPNRLQFHCVLL